MEVAGVHRTVAARAPGLAPQALCRLRYAGILSRHAGGNRARRLQQPSWFYDHRWSRDFGGQRAASRNRLVGRHAILDLNPFTVIGRSGMGLLDRQPGTPVAVCCPDKFRGSLTAVQATRAIADGLRDAGLDARELPLADGGEGTLEVLLAARAGRRQIDRVTGPLGTPVEAEWGLLDDGTAVIELARASGLALCAPYNDPLRATTRGTGELLLAAAAAGARRALVSLGGSATTDGGLGAVEALGWSLHGLEVTVACDVTTRFLDAAIVFGPQKGAGPAEIETLTRRLRDLSALYRKRTSVDIATLPGAGAAGGTAGGLAALGAGLRSGFDVVADAVELEDAFAGVDLIITGEGKLDASSLAGKVVGEVVRRTPPSAACAVIAGQIALGAREQLPAGVTTAALTERAVSPEVAIRDAAALARVVAAELGRAAASIRSTT